MSGMKQALPNGPLSVILIQVQYSPIVQIKEYMPYYPEDYFKQLYLEKS